MTADNPTVDDLRLVARNVFSEGKTSRAMLLEELADNVERIEAENAELRVALQAIYNNCMDGDCSCDIGEGQHAVSCPAIIQKIARAVLAKKA